MVGVAVGPAGGVSVGGGGPVGVTVGAGGNVGVGPEIVIDEVSLQMPLTPPTLTWALRLVDPPA